MTTSRQKKHQCPDCRMCQHCAESRCHVCRGEKSRGEEARFAMMSLADQISYYEQLNRAEGADQDPS